MIGVLIYYVTLVDLFRLRLTTTAIYVSEVQRFSQHVKNYSEIKIVFVQILQTLKYENMLLGLEYSTMETCL